MRLLLVGMACIALESSCAHLGRSAARDAQCRQSDDDAWFQAQMIQH